MDNHIIKICGVRDPETAVKIAIAGANLIGIVFHPLSPRYVDLAQAAAISYATKKSGALPVAIFVNHSEGEMRSLCEAADIHIVQLHGLTSRANHHLLPRHYRRIYALNVSDNGDIQIDEGLRHLDPDRDLILIDHENPGKGNSIQPVEFQYNLPFSWMLAGGLTSSNVVAAIQARQPDGVDVSSGVESSKGTKDILLVQQFITTVRGHHHAA